MPLVEKILCLSIGFSTGVFVMNCINKRWQDWSDITSLIMMLLCCIVELGAPWSH